MKKRLLLVGIPETFITNVIHRAQQVGFEVILADSEENLQKFCNSISDVDQCVVADFTDYDGLLKIAETLWQDAALDAIFAFKENALVNTARLVEHFGLKGNSVKAVASCIDKHLTRTILQEANLAGPTFAMIHSVEQVYSIFDRVKGPIILKPHNMIGSLGVTKVTSVSEIEEKYQFCAAHCKTPVMLAEEFITGAEVSVEAMMYQGELVIFGVTEKLLYPGTFIEAGHISPYPDRETAERIKPTIQAVVQALGITFGPLHIECFLSESGFTVGEVHTRYGGAYITTITEYAHRCDMITPIFAELSGTDHTISLETEPKAAGIKFIDVEPGVVEDIIGIDEMRRNANVIGIHFKCKRGDRIHPLRTSRDRVLSLVAHAQDREKLERVFDQAASTVRIVTSSKSL